MVRILKILKIIFYNVPPFFVALGLEDLLNVPFGVEVLKAKFFFLTRSSALASAVCTFSEYESANFFSLDFPIL
jgi:hypothetical protein